MEGKSVWDLIDLGEQITLISSDEIIVKLPYLILKDSITITSLLEDNDYDNTSKMVVPFDSKELDLLVKFLHSYWFKSKWSSKEDVIAIWTMIDFFNFSEQTSIDMLLYLIGDRKWIKEVFNLAYDTKDLKKASSLLLDEKSYDEVLITLENLRATIIDKVDKTIKVSLDNITRNGDMMFREYIIAVKKTIKSITKLYSTIQPEDPDLAVKMKMLTDKYKEIKNKWKNQSMSGPTGLTGAIGPTGTSIVGPTSHQQRS